MNSTLQHPPSSRLRDAGQSMVEYLVVLVVLVTALFVVEFNGRTGAQHLADMVRLFYRNFTYFLSLP